MTTCTLPHSSILIKDISILKEHRINSAIRARDLIVIDQNGTNLGKVPLHEGYRLASEAGMDLVEMSFANGVATCKIMNYGKFKYDLEKKARKQKTPKLLVKELRLTPRIDPHDIEIKKKQVERWIEEGHKVSIMVSFKGRENVHKDRGYAILDNFKLPNVDITSPTQEGNRVSIMLTKGK